MDEGTTAHNQNLHFVLEAPLSKITSYPFNVVKMDGGNTQCYLDSIPKGLLPLTISKIKIGSVVIDRNTAQKRLGVLIINIQFYIIKIFKTHKTS